MAQKCARNSPLSEKDERLYEGGPADDDSSLKSKKLGSPRRRRSARWASRFGFVTDFERVNLEPARRYLFC